MNTQVILRFNYLYIYAYTGLKLLILKLTIEHIKLLSLHLFGRNGTVYEDEPFCFLIFKLSNIKDFIKLIRFN